MADLVDAMGTAIGALLRENDVCSAARLRLRLMAEELTLRKPQSDFDSMESLESSADTQLLPHQIHAAHFAVSNPMLKGVLLADEVGLGKTIEAAMVIKEMIYRGARNVLIIASRSLCQQWAGELRERFAVEFEVLNADRVRQLERRKLSPYSGLRICTYHFVNQHLGEVEKTPWDLVVVDECHLLKNPQGALHRAIKRLPRGFTCLLTATPLQNYLPEIQAISTLIDEQALGTAFSFRERFCEDGRGLRAKNLEELNDRLAGFAIRTLRTDVPEIRFTQRTPKLFNFHLHEDERRLYEGVSSYLSRPTWAFGDNAAGKSLIILVYRKLLASSSFALRSALRKVQERLEEMIETGDRKPIRASSLGPALREALEEGPEDPAAAPGGGGPRDVITQTIDEELREVSEYVRLCERIAENAKGECLIAAMPELLEQGDKVLVFTQYRATQAYLCRKLAQAGYEVVAFHGDLKSHSNPEKDEREIAKQRFRTSAQVMVATDAGAEGLNLQFCHILVNYDLCWNPMKLEQRIGRCHRIGQEHDVVVANLVALENAVDARLVELLTDKIHLFDSVLGESDEILGAIEDALDFEQAIFHILQTCRTPDEIDQAFGQLQLDLEFEIEERQTHGRSLLQGFDDRIRDHLDIAGARAQEALDKRTTLLRDFLLGAVSEFGARVDEIEPGVHRFTTPSHFLLHAGELLDPAYTGAFGKSAGASHTYLTKRHPLVRAALDILLQEGRKSAVRLRYTGRHTIHGLEELVGQRGWWLTARVSFSGFEVEDHLVHLAWVVADGQPMHHELLSGNIARVTAEGGAWDSALLAPSEESLQELLAAQVQAIEEGILERNAHYYVERRGIIDRYYGPAGDGEVLAELKHQIAEKRAKVDELQGAIDATGTMKAKMDLMREQDRLNDDLFQLEQRLQAEQLESFENRKAAIRELEQLRELGHSVELVSIAQWAMH